jgi:hypothetical protein
MAARGAGAAAVDARASNASGCFFPVKLRQWRPVLIIKDIKHQPGIASNHS